MNRIALASLGCKTNQYEIDALAEWFRRHGFTIVDDKEPAEVYVLNTCTVTAEAERKARQLLRRYRKLNSEALTVVCGCYAQRSDLREMADICIGTAGRSVLPQLILGALEQTGSRGGLEKAAFQTDVYEELGVPAVPSETRAFLKVQDGCDNRCAYCAISLARGRARSRSIKNIILEARALAARGFSEFVLTGTNLNLYGSDFHGAEGAKNTRTADLADVINAVSQVEGVRRIRLGSLESTLMTEDFVERISGIRPLCPSFHLSLQSGSDRILKAMNRRDSRASYRDAVSRLRAAFPGAGITTDLIVGFPGETKEDFEETLAFSDEIGFLRIHVFRFSRRPRTLADKMPGQVPAAIAMERSEILRAKAAELAVKAIADRMGQSFEVLVEQFDDKGRAEGYTPEYIFVKGVARRRRSDRDALGGDMPARGAIVPMKIVGSDGETAVAEVLSAENAL